jgi:hypothetical protein
VYIDKKIQYILASTMPLIIEFFCLRTDKNNNFKFTIKFLMTLDRSYIGYLSFLGIDLFKSVLMYSNGAICLINNSASCVQNMHGRQGFILERGKREWSGRPLPG